MQMTTTLYLRPGARERERVVVVDVEVEVEVERDLEVPGVWRTAMLVQELANSICLSIQMAVVFPSNHHTCQSWIFRLGGREEDRTVDWNNYRKPISSPYTNLNNSAMPGKVKRLALVQEEAQEHSALPPRGANSWSDGGPVGEDAAVWVSRGL